MVHNYRKVFICGKVCKYGVNMSGIPKKAAKIATRKIHTQGNSLVVSLPQGLAGVEKGREVDLFISGNTLYIDLGQEGQ